MHELKRRKLEIKLDGKLTEMRFPSVKEVKEFAEGEKKAKDKLDYALIFFEKLGLKKEISEGLELEHLTFITEEILGLKKK